MPQNSVAAVVVVAGAVAVRRHRNNKVDLVYVIYSLAKPRHKTFRTVRLQNFSPFYDGTAPHTYIHIDSSERKSCKSEREIFYVNLRVRACACASYTRATRVQLYFPRVENRFGIPHQPTDTLSRAHADASSAYTCIRFCAHAYFQSN